MSPYTRARIVHETVRVLERSGLVYCQQMAKDGRALERLIRRGDRLPWWSRSWFVNVQAEIDRMREGLR